VIYFAHIFRIVRARNCGVLDSQNLVGDFEVPTGNFSDFLGRKLTLALGQLASALSIASYAAANSFGTLAIGGVLEGLSFSLFSGNNDALLFETLKQKSREGDSRVCWRLSACFSWLLQSRGRRNGRTKMGRQISRSLLTASSASRSRRAARRCCR